MLSQLTKILLISLSLFSFMLLRAPLVAAQECSASDPKSAIECGVNSSAGKSGDTTDAGESLSKTVASALKILSAIIGIVAVIMIIVAGLRFVTSGGSPEGTKTAKAALLYAVIGLVIVIVAQLLVHFVLGKTNQAINNDSGGGGSSNLQPADRRK